MGITLRASHIPIESYFTSLDFYLVTLYSLNNVFEAIFGVYLIRLFFGKSLFLSTIRSSTSFIIVVAFFSTFITAFIGTLLSFYMEGRTHFYDMLLTWWLGDAAGLMLMVPLLLSWQSPKRNHSLLKQSILLIVFSILLAFVGFYVFHVGYHLAYLFIPFFIYFTFRFGRFLSFVMAFIISLVSMAIVIYLNTYWLWNTPEEGIFYVRLFILILLLTILMVAAVLDEQYLAKERDSGAYI
jgi:integral membrane sensor domain MASE1